MSKTMTNNREPLTLEKFAELNRSRCIESFKEHPHNYPFECWVLGLCGEAGELAQEIKRLRDAQRARMSYLQNGGSTSTKQFGKLFERESQIIKNIYSEIGDILPYLDMVAQAFGWSLEECTIEKFNEVSDRRGSDIKIIL
jgi:NTP pyrophosphatase (non-canonical NTP hydrolase)